MNWEELTTPEGVSVKVHKVEVPGDYDFNLGVAAAVGQYVVEEEKETDGVKVFSHYVMDSPDPSWKKRSVGVSSLLDAVEEGKAPDRVIGELDQRTEAELIDLAALYEIEGEPGVPLKVSLARQLKEKLEGDGYEGGPAVARVRSDLAGIEGLDVPPNSSNTDPEPRDETQLRDTTTTTDSTEAEAEAETEAEAEAETDRPSGNADYETWYEYRLAQGKTEADLEGLGRNELRDLD